MKTIIILLMSAICLFANAQDTVFTFTKEGFTDFVITQCPGKTAAEMYKRTVDWITVTYNTPKEVMKAQIENDYIRIEGSSDRIIFVKVMGSGNWSSITYQIEISFKDGKYKFDVIEIKSWSAELGWSEWDFKNNMSSFYNKKGEIRKMYAMLPETVPAYFNNLNRSLYNYITGVTTSKKSDW